MKLYKVIVIEKEDKKEDNFEKIVITKIKLNKGEVDLLAAYSAKEKNGECTDYEYDEIFHGKPYTASLIAKKLLTGFSRYSEGPYGKRYYSITRLCGLVIKKLKKNQIII